MKRLPEIQGQSLAVTVLHVPYSLDSGPQAPLETSRRLCLVANRVTLPQKWLPYMCHIRATAAPTPCMGENPYAGYRVNVF